ncbi:MAG: NAD(P)H-quinone oxidoreductase [Caulobacteraceae bacterium]|nr:NAD(P)H-quinone oxidoreductase [Caulobacteraceae bacterium]
MPEQMTAIRVEGGKGPAEALKPALIATPKPGAGQILVKVRAAGVNRPDVVQRRGYYPPPPGAPETLGLEVAGEVAALGEVAARWRVGDAVTALLGGGGYAAYAAVDARHALPIPVVDGRPLDWVQAAALPETAFTVYANVFEHGALQAGETFMVHGATSGIGVAAIQMAKAAGARVIATARGAAKAAKALELGADAAVDATAEDFAAVAQAHGGADVILDMVAGPYFAKNIDALRPGGRLVHIASLAGDKVELAIMKMMQKRIVITGSTLRPRDADEKARLAAEVEARVWPWVAAGQLRAIVDRVFPLEQAAAAHAWLEGGDHVGKVMLTP